MYFKGAHQQYNFQRRHLQRHHFAAVVAKEEPIILAAITIPAISGDVAPMRLIITAS